MDYRAINKSDPNNELTHWKYVKREKANGKWKYYYSWDELKKDAKNIGNTIKNTVKDKLGFDERADLNKAERKLNSAKLTKFAATNFQSDPAVAARSEVVLRGSQSNYNGYLERYKKTPLGKLDEMGKSISKGVETVGKFFDRTADVVKDKLGYDERDNKDQAMKKLAKTMSNPNAHKDRKKDDHANAKKAVDAYNKTALGKYENAKREIKDLGKDMERAVRRNKPKIEKKVSEIRDKIDDKLGFDERDEIRRQRDTATKAESEALDAERKYGKNSKTAVVKRQRAEDASKKYKESYDAYKKTYAGFQDGFLSDFTESIQKGQDTVYDFFERLGKKKKR